MASSVIHLCVAKEINKKLNHNEKEIFLGSIAPDIAKLVGDNKIVSHFQNGNDDIPIISKFLDKYSSNLNDDFILGYYIHLYTDYLWFKFFMTDIEYKNSIKLLDGEVLNLDEETFVRMLYNDYTNLNVQLLDEYNLDLSLFYEPLVVPKTKMDEIPVEKLQILLDKAGLIIENTRLNKEYLFDVGSVKKFIDFSSDVIYSEIKTLNISS